MHRRMTRTLRLMTITHKLIDHFHYLYVNGRVHWPKRNGPAPETDGNFWSF